jgi:hypothetical protein
MYWYMQFNVEICLALCIIIILLNFFLFRSISLYLRFIIFEIAVKAFHIYSRSVMVPVSAKSYTKFFCVFKILFGTLT